MNYTIQQSNIQRKNNNEAPKPLLSTPITGAVPYAVLRLNFSELEPGITLFENGDKVKGALAFGESLKTHLIQQANKYGYDRNPVTNQDLGTVTSDIIAFLSKLRENCTGERSNSIMILIDEFDFILKTLMENGLKALFKGMASSLIIFLNVIKKRQSKIILFYHTGALLWEMRDVWSGINCTQNITFYKSIKDSFIISQEECDIYFWNMYEQIALRDSTFKYEEGIGDEQKEAARISFGRNLLIEKCNGYNPNPISKGTGFKVIDLEYARKNLEVANWWMETGPENYMENMASSLSVKDRKTFLTKVKTKFRDVS